MNAGEITEQLIAAREGEREAMDRLFELVYGRLHRIAHGQLGRRRDCITLSTTALVHEAYLKMVDPSRIDLRDRDHFFAVAARAMRQILVDHVRGRMAKKRGAGAPHEPLHESRVGFEGRVVDLLALDGALRKLELLSGRLCRVVELRFFAGLSVEEIAGVAGVTSRTVKRDWRKARAFLLSVLEPQPPS